MTKKEKEKKRDAFKLPPNNATKEQQVYYLWCMRNNVKVSVGGIKEMAGHWVISVFNNGKWVNTPRSYNAEELYDAYYDICKYYYEKYGKQEERAS